MHDKMTSPVVFPEKPTGLLQRFVLRVKAVFEKEAILVLTAILEAELPQYPISP